MIELDDVVVRYRRGFSLGPLSMSFDQGITFLLGANGAGKSTLLRLLADQQQPTSGRISPARRGTCGFLPQEPSLPHAARCQDYLAFIAWLQGVPKTERQALVDKVLGAVDLTDRATAKIGEMSGGMARRLSIAQALLAPGDTLLMDEPMTGLDPLQRIQLRKLLPALAKGRTLVVSTHLLEDVREVADRIVILKSGSVTFDGTADELERIDSADQIGQSAMERAVARLMSADSA